MRTVEHVVLFLALHSSADLRQPSSPGLPYLQVIFGSAGAARLVTLVTVILGRPKDQDATWMPRSLFFLPPTSRMGEASIA